jgi:hypothetical protein
MFIYGMWFGIVYRRWHLIGLNVFIAAQATVLAVAALIVTGVHAWAGVGRFFTGLNRSRADRPARRPGGDPAGRRIRHHPPRHRLNRVWPRSGPGLARYRSSP